MGGGQCKFPDAKPARSKQLNPGANSERERERDRKAYRTSENQGRDVKTTEDSLDCSLEKKKNNEAVSNEESFSRERESARKQLRRRRDLHRTDASTSQHNHGVGREM